MTLTSRRRVASTRLFCLLLLLPLGAAAQTPAASGPDAAGTAAAPQLELDGAATGPERFDIQLEAPATIQPFLLRHLDLQRYRNLQDLDGSELDRLLIAAHNQRHRGALPRLFLRWLAYRKHAPALEPSLRTAARRLLCHPMMHH